MKPPGIKTYPDTAQGAMEGLRDMTAPGYVSKDLQAVADPQVRGVWLVVDKAKKMAHIVYVNDGDFETVDSYSDALKTLRRSAPIHHYQESDEVEAMIDEVARSRGAGQPPAARYTSQQDLPSGPPETSDPEAFEVDGVSISFKDIDSIEPDVEGGVKVIFTNGVRKIITFPESEQFLEWFNEQNEERAEAMKLDRIDTAIDGLVNEAELPAGPDIDIGNLKVGDTVKDSEGGVVAPVKGKAVIFNRGHASKDEDGTITLIKRPVIGDEIRLTLRPEDLAAIHEWLG
jgi:hypothetical protein